MPQLDESPRRLTIHARRALVANVLRHDVAIDIDDGRIAAVRSFGEDEHPRRVHSLVSPGLIDLQCNGLGVHAVIGGSIDSLQRCLAEAGTTSFLPTITTCQPTVLRRAYDTVMAAAGNASDGRARILGVHLEGPFLGRRPGAHDVHLIAKAVDEVDDVFDACGEGLRMMTLAAESPVAGAVMEKLSARNIVASIGHSAPSREEYARLVAAGATCCTHIFNAMSGVEHRGFGLAGAVLDDPAMYAGLIGDLVHVDAETIRLVFRCKGPGRIFLVSDSVATTSGVEAEGLEVTDAARLPDGTLAGAVVPLAEQVRCIVQRAGVSLIDALVAATSTPAEVIGAGEIGALEVGRFADITCFDEHLRVESTYVAGVPVVRGS